ncbi:alpha-galactosidase A precursor [Dactylonectria macrodidyma]|uniref:Alpha-galactosidase A n=1 Tax=Dactylonectria macrodidyma TaxID=307937 RepID=A0A9P9EQK1_9HYPO|nr:alpha-galactosidase A precursor [Dactylonectria macrodidyma]
MTTDPIGLQLLQASVHEDDESDFRILVDNTVVKYITIAPGLFSQDDMCFAPSLFSLLPPLPSGDWNKGRVSRNPITGIAHFETVAKVQLPGINNTWKPCQIDHLELQMGRKLRSNVYEATCPRFGFPVIAKFARFSWEMPLLEAETTAYEWIEGSLIGPDFLGHLIEEGRVIGFVIARIDNFRHATLDDLPLCLQALSTLHELGVRHGDTNKHNFLIHKGRVTLIDFDNASRTASPHELELELRDLGDKLLDSTGKGGRVVERSLG